MFPGKSDPTGLKLQPSAALYIEEKSAHGLAGGTVNGGGWNRTLESDPNGRLILH